jgi:blue light- and temperature-responsive anti-repressor
MPDSLHRLVYYSRNALPGPEPALAAEVAQILASSRRNNPRADVTGALMFNRGCFAQVLEGPRAAVEATFERIQRDPRHADVMLLQFAPVGRRGFPSWSMAFVGRSRRGGSLYGAIAGESGFDPALLDGERLFATLRGLVLEEEGAPEGEPAAAVA